MGKRIEIKAQTKQNIIAAFWSLYCEKRIESITVKEIAHLAGYNRGTFYEYFSDVYDVLADIEKSLIPTLNELPPVLISSGTLGMPLDAFFELYERNSKYYSVLLGERGDPAFASKLKNAIKPMIMQIFSNIPNVNLIELDFIMEYTLSAMIGIMSYWCQQTNACAYDELHQLIYRLMEHGVIMQLPPLTTRR